MWAELATGQLAETCGSLLETYCTGYWRKQTDQQTDKQTGQKQYVPHYYIYLREKAPPLGGHVFHDIIGTLYRVLKRFFESRTIAPTDNRSYAKFDKADSRSYDVLTGRTERLSALSKHRRSDCPPCQNIVGATVRPVKFSERLSGYQEKCPTPGAHVFEPTGTIFDLAKDIILTNLLTKFHDDGQ
ncbi:hypothetical protein DPMN_119304 [Dreissena polymorpha]|uniref:Uncharacterized protein n=1 Tax=Dreissena polymorpha TaxID=45954 RepID=A0A9D4GIF2_DREPO|nr:hypothetical protein DPMN_119304 [Dreissena polymorpha]